MYEEYARLRDALGVTDYYIGKELGIPSTSISNWKLGKRRLSIDNLRKLARYFNVSLEQLLGESSIEDAVESAHDIAGRYRGISDEAAQIALLYDKADDRVKDIVHSILSLPVRAI